MKSPVPPEAVTLLPAPTWGPRPANPPVTGQGLVVTGQAMKESSGTASATAAAAWALVEWLALGDPAAERYSGGQGLPASREQVNWKSGPGLPKWSAAVQKELDETGCRPVPASPKHDLDKLCEVWNRQEERYLVGEIGLDAMLANVEEEMVHGLNG